MSSSFFDFYQFTPWSDYFSWLKRQKTVVYFFIRSLDLHFSSEKRDSGRLSSLVSLKRDFFATYTKNVLFSISEKVLWHIWQYRHSASNLIWGFKLPCSFFLCCFQQTRRTQNAQQKESIRLKRKFINHREQRPQNIVPSITTSDNSEPGAWSVSLPNDTIAHSLISILVQLRAILAYCFTFNQVQKGPPSKAMKWKW